MNTKNIVSLAILSYAYADVNADASRVASLANSLLSQVEAYQSGINDALGIQIGYPTLSSAVVTLQNDLGSAGTDVVTSAFAATLQELTTNVSNLLNALANKATAFQQAGAGQIVQGDLNGLYGPSVQIASSLVSLASGQCEIVSSVAPGLASMDAAFSRAATSFSISSTAFPTPLGCNGASSAPGSSAPASSAPGSSAPASSAPGSSAPASSAPPSASATETSPGSQGTTYRCRVPAQGSQSAFITTVTQA